MKAVVISTIHSIEKGFNLGYKIKTSEVDLKLVQMWKRIRSWEDEGVFHVSCTMDSPGKLKKNYCYMGLTLVILLLNLS